MWIIRKHSFADAVWLQITSCGCGADADPVVQLFVDAVQMRCRCGADAVQMWVTTSEFNEYFTLSTLVRIYPQRGS